jgi:hypothetical protein
MANVAANIASYYGSQGRPVPISLLEMQTPAGRRLFFSTAPITTPTLLSLFDTSATTSVTTATTPNSWPVADTQDTGDSATVNPEGAYNNMGGPAIVTAGYSSSAAAYQGGSIYWRFLCTSSAPANLAFNYSFDISNGTGSFEIQVSFDFFNTWTTILTDAGATSGSGTINYATAVPAGGDDAFIRVITSATSETTPGTIVAVQISSLTYITADPVMATIATNGGQTSSAFLPLLLDPPAFSVTCDLVTQTASATIDNLGGDTVNRTNSALFTAQDLWGSLFVYRIYDPALEYAKFTQIGTVEDASIDDDHLSLQLSSWLNFSKIAAPDCQINNNCQNVFGSPQCGSTSSVNCLNSYGSCSQINRFKGLITQWNSGVYTVSTNAGFAQPTPLISYNGRSFS